jgi:hypothetical protein
MPGALRLETILAKARRSGRTDDELYFLLEELQRLPHDTPPPITGSTLINIDVLTTAGIFIHFPPAQQIPPEPRDVIEA